MAGLGLGWADPNLNWLDAGLNCRLRYFTRDTGIGHATYAADVAAANRDEESLGFTTDTPAGPGVAAWRNVGPVPDYAREALQNAARVEIPRGGSSFGLVAGYLVVLVPMNWLVFMALGRVEWAWAAAPVIALCSTLAVIHMAQLDIGFARSETELAVLEIQADYPRAHLTRYTALYTSLTTQYTFRHEDANAVVQPFRARARRGEGLTTLHYRHGKDVNLEGFVVPSNTVDMIRGEQMVRSGRVVGIDPQPARKLASGQPHGLDAQGGGRFAPNRRRRDSNCLGRRDRADRQRGTGVLSNEKTEGPWWPDQREEDVETRATPVLGEFNLRKLVDWPRMPRTFGRASFV